MNQCSILKTAFQELIDNDQDVIYIDVNGSEEYCIVSFLESLSPKGTYIERIYYQGFFFVIGFSTP